MINSMMSDTVNKFAAASKVYLRTKVMAFDADQMLSPGKGHKSQAGNVVKKVAAYINKTAMEDWIKELIKKDKEFYKKYWKTQQDPKFTYQALHDMAKEHVGAEEYAKRTRANTGSGARYRSFEEMWDDIAAQMRGARESSQRGRGSTSYQYNYNNNYNNTRRQYTPKKNWANIASAVATVAVPLGVMWAMNRKSHKTTKPINEPYDADIGKWQQKAASLNIITGISKTSGIKGKIPRIIGSYIDDISGKRYRDSIKSIERWSGTGYKGKADDMADAVIRRRMHKIEGKANLERIRHKVRARKEYNNMYGANTRTWDEVQKDISAELGKDTKLYGDKLNTAERFNNELKLKTKIINQKAEDIKQRVRANTTGRAQRFNDNITGAKRRMHITRGITGASLLGGGVLAAQKWGDGSTNE